MRDHEGDAQPIIRAGLRGKPLRPLNSDVSYVSKSAEMNDIEKFRARIKGINGYEFIQLFNEICLELEKKNNILTFGFIIFDESNPEIRKILRDNDYWDALDKASGDRMMIFAASDKVKIAKKRDHTIGLIAAFNPPPARSKTKSFSLLMNELFNSDALLAYPSVIFFQVENGNIFDYRLVPLNRRNTWESMFEVQKLFTSVSDVLNSITQENYGNRAEIFQLVRNELDRQEYTMYILNGPKRIADFIGVIKNLLFL